MLSSFSGVRLVFCTLPYVNTLHKFTKDSIALKIAITCRSRSNLDSSMYILIFKMSIFVTYCRTNTNGNPKHK